MEISETNKRKIYELENSDPKTIDEFLKIEREINRLVKKYSK